MKQVAALLVLLLALPSLFLLGWQLGAGEVPGYALVVLVLPAALLVTWLAGLALSAGVATALIWVLRKADRR